MYQSTAMQVGLIATPDVHSFELTKKDNFILLGCDGLWGVCSFILLCYISFFLIWIPSIIFMMSPTCMYPRYLDQVMLLNLSRSS
jgi:integrin-linked kinase-associated serine/threonine phosphatase 2C